MNEGFFWQADLKGDLLRLGAGIAHVAQHLGRGVPKLDFRGHMEFSDGWVPSLGRRLGDYKR